MESTVVIDTEQAVIAAPDATDGPPPEAEQPVTLFDDIVAKLRLLTADKQMEVRDFVEFLIHKAGPKRPRKSLRGLWANLDVDITEEDIAEARREMWGNFPRDVT